MKATAAVYSAAILGLAAVAHVNAAIIAGPIVSPHNGHEYYLLTTDTWTASEAEAEQLGGTLAILRNAAEQEWVFSTFGSYGGTNRDLWIGLHRQGQGGPFAWVTDAKLDFVNWASGQPDNSGGAENCAHLWASVNPRGCWNDINDGTRLSGVAEVPGVSSGKSLTRRERSVIGTWYENGDGDRPCWITGAGNLLFAIDPNRNTSRVIFTTEGFLFACHWKQHAEILKDRIIWSKGNWWSRKPAAYRTAEKSSSDAAETNSQRAKSRNRQG